jgi:arylsulfatase
MGKGGKVTLYTDGKKVGEGNIEATLCLAFSADDGLDVGEDSGAPVSPDYGAVGNRFNGTVKGALLSIEEDKGAHKVDPAEAVRLAMARQ